MYLNIGMIKCKHCSVKTFLKKDLEKQNIEEKFKNISVKIVKGFLQMTMVFTE